MNTLDSLLVRALVVMNETRKRMNTSTRIGSLFQDILIWMSNLVLGIILKGSKADFAAIQAIVTKERGDTYRADDTGHYWVWDGTQWNDIGEVIPAEVATKEDVNALARNVFIPNLDIDLSGVLWREGFFNTSGNLNPTSTWTHTSPIAVSPGDVYRIQTVATATMAAVAAVDVNGNWIKTFFFGTGVTGTMVLNTYLVAIPEGVNYISIGTSPANISKAKMTVAQPWIRALMPYNIDKELVIIDTEGLWMDDYYVNRNGTFANNVCDM